MPPQPLGKPNILIDCSSSSSSSISSFVAALCSVNFKKVFLLLHFKVPCVRNTKPFCFRHWFFSFHSLCIFVVIASRSLILR